MGPLYPAKKDKVIGMIRPSVIIMRESDLAWNDSFLLLITFLPYPSRKTFHFIYLLRVPFYLLDGILLTHGLF